MKWFHSLITLTVRIAYLVLTFFTKLIKIMQGTRFELEFNIKKVYVSPVDAI